jgi:hypothetical protein
VKEVPKKIPTCVEHEWAIFNQNVEEVKTAAQEHFEDRELPWLLQVLMAIPKGIGGGEQEDAIDSAADRFKDWIPDVINLAAKEKEIEEGTKRAAEKRDQRIQENCKKP